MGKELETYCLYCHKSESEIRKKRREHGYRIKCEDRGTPEGFHSFRVRCVVCKKHWKKCICDLPQEDKRV